MRIMGELQQLIMITLMEADSDGMTVVDIQKRITKRKGDEVQHGAVYQALQRFESDGRVKKHRSGRYVGTREGFLHLYETKKRQVKTWRGVDMSTLRNRAGIKLKKAKAS